MRVGNTGPPTGDIEHLLNLFGENALSRHAFAELGVVEFAATQGT